MPNDDIIDDGNGPDSELVCYFCGDETTRDRYCSGCKSFICQACHEKRVPRGPHEPEAHQND